MSDEWKPSLSKPNVVCDKSYTFALKIVSLARTLRKQGEYELASQVLRSGTSIGANIEEAQSGVSQADFAAKIGIASKEARDALLAPIDSRCTIDPAGQYCAAHPRSKRTPSTPDGYCEERSSSSSLNIEHSPLKIRKVPYA
ncbi:MAG: four helix bundle protein [Nitrospirota bacterium]